MHRTGKNEKKKRKMKTEKEKEKKEMGTHCKPIHQLHGTGSSMPAVSLWFEGHGQSRADHRPCAEAVGGGGDMQVMHTMSVQAVVVVETSRWHGNLIFWYSGVCGEGAQTHRTGGKKKTKVKKTTQKKSEKQTYRLKPPQKHRPPQASHVCMASVRARREVRGGGVHGDCARRVFVGTLRWRGCFDFVRACREERGLSGVEGRGQST